MRRLRQQQPPRHREQLAGRDVVEQRWRITTAGTPATTTGPAGGGLAGYHGDRQQLLRRGAAVLKRNDLIENLCYRLGYGADVGEGVPNVFGAVPRGGADVPVQHQSGAAVFDLFDEVPHHQRSNALVPLAEQRITVVQNDFEQRRERRLQVGDVGGVEFDRLLLEQPIIGATGVFVAPFEFGVALHQREHVFAVRGRVLR